MSFSETQVTRRIASSGNDKTPAPGWQADVFRTIRDEDRPVRLRLVAHAPNPMRRVTISHRSLFFAGFTLAAVLAFFLVLEQRPDDRITKRTDAIAMVVEFVELETEMTNALAEIDSTEARMDEEFRELQMTLASHAQPAPVSSAAKTDAPTPAQRRESVRRRKSKRNEKSKKASVAKSCPAGIDVMCGL